MIDGARILVVEDDAAINKVVCSYLGKLGAECVPAFSGTEGLMRLEGERRFDLLITDLMLPGAPGEEVVAAARAQHVPIIVLSARRCFQCWWRQRRCRLRESHLRLCIGQGRWAPGGFSGLGWHRLWYRL